MFVPLTPLEFRRRAALLYSRKVGIVDGEERFTYAQFSERVDRLANGLRALGIQKGEVVSFVSYNCHQLLEAYYGVIQIGAILNPINVRMAAGEIEYILNHSECKALCFHSDFRPLIHSMQERVPGLRYFLEMEPAQPLLGGHHDYEQILSNAQARFEGESLSDENDPAELLDRKSVV